MNAQTWYAKQHGGPHEQASIACEQTGRTVAVVYDGPKDAGIIAAAPELVELARDIVCARADYLDPLQFYAVMDAIADKAHRLLGELELTPDDGSDRMLGDYIAAENRDQALIDRLDAALAKAQP